MPPFKLGRLIQLPSIYRIYQHITMNQRAVIIIITNIEPTQRQPHLSSKPSHTSQNATGTTTTHPQSHPQPRETTRQRQASQEPSPKSQELTQTAQYSRKATAYLAAPLIPSTGPTRNALTGEHTKKIPDPVLVNRRRDRPRQYRVIYRLRRRE